MQRTADFDYELPPARIAKRPAEPRDHARLLIDNGPDLQPSSDHVFNLPDHLEPGDVVVVNQTRVLPARLDLIKETGGVVEVLLLERRGPTLWEALVRPGRRVPVGTVVRDSEGRISVTVGRDIGDGVRLVEVGPGPSVVEGRVDNEVFDDCVALVEAVGNLPLPPYLSDVVLDDPERYQTVFSTDQPPVSSAAPTAGLHLTEALIGRLRSMGIDVVAIDLVVGLGTFRPITTELVADHVMHCESYQVDPQVWAKIIEAERVVAVGTTTVRTLETVASTGKMSGQSELFIHGDYPFRVVDRLLTNFHQPCSSLLVMIEAFIGPRWRNLYQFAQGDGFRFLSLGDAMLLTRKDHWSALGH